jgi:NAD(P)-dependent dehydrogenase (short-subunit alcohol dehydrogenase family)
MPKGALIVTGGSRGIGAAVCRRAAEDGWDVVVNYAGNKARAEQVAAQVEGAGRKAAVVQADCANIDDIPRLFDEAEAALGPIGALVNNAGRTGRISTLIDSDVDDILKTLNINVVGAILVAREAVRRMSAKRGGLGGPIVNISSTAAKLGSANAFVWYAASKGAIDSFTTGLGQEAIGDGIRVNSVAPGLVDTEIHAQTGYPERTKDMAPTVPIGRAADPAEIAEAVVWLLSDAASYVVGATLRVGGGR